MKSFTRNTFRNLALFALVAAALSACGGAGTCSTCAPNFDGLTLSIEAPSQYPAGLPTPIQATLTMTNTSSVNATNLVYTIPAPGTAGNYTKVVITPNAGIGSSSGACTNIAAGASCTFVATISAYASPGSFTVTATPNATVNSQSSKTTQAGKALQSSISVTANLGLVDIPNTNSEYYILPSDQTIQGSATSSTTAYVSVLVKVAGEGLNSLKFVDETGKELSYTAVGNPRYTVNSVNSYKVTIPAGKSLQHIQVLSNVCTTLNNGTNNDTACSNDADINLAQSGVGILAIQPNYFQMSESITSQVITLQNIGTANITSLQFPTIAAPFSVLSNTCTAINTLTPNSSCLITIGYTVGATSGQGSYVVNYNNGNNTVNTIATIPYIGTSSVTPFSILTVQPSSISLTANNPRQVLTITNTAGGSTSGVTIAGVTIAGVTIAGGWTLPTLPAPLELDSTNCVTSSAPVMTKSLAVGTSCTYTIKYPS